MTSSYSFRSVVGDPSLTPQISYRSDYTWKQDDRSAPQRLVGIKQKYMVKCSDVTTVVTDSVTPP
jgi:hypothetical protein